MLAVTDLLESLLLQKVRFEDPNVDYWGSQDATFVVLDVFSKLVVAETLENNWQIWNSLIDFPFKFYNFDIIGLARPSTSW